jgi:hypothetical protein
MVVELVRTGKNWNKNEARGRARRRDGCSHVLMAAAARCARPPPHSAAKLYAKCEQGECCWRSPMIISRSAPRSLSFAARLERAARMIRSDRIAGRSRTIMRGILEQPFGFSQIAACSRWSGRRRAAALVVSARVESSRTERPPANERLTAGVSSTGRPPERTRTTAATADWRPGRPRRIGQ